MGLHSRLAPSASYAWSICPHRAHAVPEDGPQTAATIKGNRGHKRVADLVKSGDEFKSRESRDVKVFVNHVRAEREADPHALMMVETTLQSLTEPDLFGTPDILFVGENYLQVVDLKTGRWHVPAKNNPQLMTYLYLAIDNFGERPMYFGEIVQYGKVDGTMWTPAQMTTFGETVAWAASNPDIYEPGDHCRFCPWFKQCDVGKLYAIEAQRTWAIPFV